MKSNLRFLVMNGLCLVGKIPGTSRFLDVQLLSFTRKISDGITFFHFEINLDLYKSKPNPMFKIELTILNCYNNITIHS